MSIRRRGRSLLERWPWIGRDKAGIFFCVLGRQCQTMTWSFILMKIWFQHFFSEFICTNKYSTRLRFDQLRKIGSSFFANSNDIVEGRIKRKRRTEDVIIGITRQPNELMESSRRGRAGGAITNSRGRLMSVGRFLSGHSIRFCLYDSSNSNNIILFYFLFLPICLYLFFFYRLITIRCN